MDKFDSIAWAVIAFMFLFAVLAYPIVQDPMIDHWNAKGEPDGYSSKTFGLFLMPIISALILGFLQIIPKIAVYKANIKKFYRYYSGFKVIIALFFLGIYAATLLPNIGYNIPINYVIIPLLAMLFFYLGYLMPVTKRNFFIGIRTPWTLASEKVWDKTHKKGGVGFKFLAAITLLSAFDSRGIWIMVIASLVLMAYLFYYSYIQFKKTRR